ncbi:MAG: DUF1559 domain-containing protein, partial [Planctomycetota bacterium]|nr:DUF1559 domain-containing protein [Planctomycetota bacterium]
KTPWCVKTHPTIMKTRRGFTLVELLAVIAVVGMLVALLLPAVQQSRAAARRMLCSNNLKQLALAAHGYHAVAESFPPGLDQFEASTSPRYRGTSVFTYLLPHLEQGNLLSDWNYEHPLNNTYGGGKARAAAILPVFLCPADHIENNPTSRGGRYHGMTSYGGNGGTRSFDPGLAACDGIFHTTGTASEPQRDQQPVSLAMIADGTAQTLLFGERNHHDRNFHAFAARGWADPLSQLGRWAAIGGRKSIGDVTMSGFVAINHRMPVSFENRAAADPPINSSGDFYLHEQRRVCAFGSSHAGGANFALTDGSVRFLSEALPLETLQALCTRDAQEVVEGF